MKRKHKPVPVVVYYKTGRVFKRFGSYLELGSWLFSKRGLRGRVIGWSDRDLLLFKRLRLSPTMVCRASDAYVSWLMGESRIRPLPRR